MPPTPARRRPAVTTDDLISGLTLAKSRTIATRRPRREGRTHACIDLRLRHAIRHHRHENWSQVVTLAQALQGPGDRPVVEVLSEAVARARAHLGGDRRCAIRLFRLDRLQMTLTAIDGFDESVGDQAACRFDGAKAQGPAVGGIHWNLLLHHARGYTSSVQG